MYCNVPAHLTHKSYCIDSSNSYGTSTTSQMHPYRDRSTLTTGHCMNQYYQNSIQFHQYDKPTSLSNNATQLHFACQGSVPLDQQGKLQKSLAAGNKFEKQR